MRFAFSTLSCPEWTVEQIIAAASEFGYDGVEWRVYLGSTDLIARFSQIPDLGQQFSRAGVEIPCVDTSVALAALDIAGQTTLGRAYIDLAASLGASFVRVFGGKAPEGEPWPTTLARGSSVLSELADHAQTRGVTVLLETHDSFSRGAQVAEMLDLVASDAAGALWDVHHPYRHGETAEETLQRLGDRLRFVHLKDARRGGQLVLPGEGDLPLPGFVSALAQAGYGGYVSFEWEKAWHPELEEPEVALPFFIEYMRSQL